MKQEAYTPAEEDVRATAAALLKAAKKLDSNPDAQAIWAHSPGTAGSSVRKYIIKRNHAGFARKVIKMTLDINNWQSTPTLASVLKSPHSHYQAPHVDIPKDACKSGLLCHSTPEGSPCPAKSSQLPSNASQPRDAATTAAGDAAAAFGHPPVFQEPELPCSGPRAALGPRHTAPHITQQPPGNQQEQQHDELQGSNGGEVQSVDLLQGAQQLLKAGQRILTESCGEAWLLQPFIADMGNNEYRSACSLPAGRRQFAVANVQSCSACCSVSQLSQMLFKSCCDQCNDLEKPALLGMLTLPLVLS